MHHLSPAWGWCTYLILFGVRNWSFASNLLYSVRHPVPLYVGPHQLRWPKKANKHNVAHVRTWPHLYATLSHMVGFSLR